MIKICDLALRNRNTITAEVLIVWLFGLIKSFIYFFPIRSYQSFLNAIPQWQKQFLLSTANVRTPDACNKKTSKCKVTDSFKTHSLTY